ncbi:hypothetical protein AVEN_104668-1 [Araneus ventricosus]|uniref:Uncharacterized protein n=1 Tax=Araneus ventricosus TaxID=182803 RepID=A0A4Y2BEC1_ARAVE|nr:hypothetical protein AVEN_104668-1 [Araneus ventricosus]
MTQCRGMLMTMRGPILLVKLKNCCKSSSGKSGATLRTAQIWQPLITFSEIEGTGTSLPEDRDEKSATENYSMGMGHFYQASYVQINA